MFIYDPFNFVTNFNYLTIYYKFDYFCKLFIINITQLLSKVKEFFLSTVLQSDNINGMVME